MDRRMTVFVMTTAGGPVYRVKREGDAGYVLSTRIRQRAAEYAGRAAEWVTVGR